MGHELDTIDIDSTWRQGAILQASCVAALCPILDGDHYGIIVSHDCDVVSRSLEKEPVFEWVPAREIPKPDSLKERGRNPRELHLRHALEGSVHLELKIVERQFHSRKELLPRRPLGVLAPHHVETLRGWMGGRYNRSAFPDAFNERRRRVSKEIRKLFDSPEGQLVSSLYVLLNTKNELEEGSDYRIAIRGILTDSENLPVARQAAEKMMEELTKRLEKCSGIQVEDSRAILAKDFSLAEARFYDPFDDWDDLSRVE